MSERTWRTSRGYSQPLYLLPFDHRHSYETQMFGLATPLTPEQRQGISESKRLIYDGFMQALGPGLPPWRAGILVDEEFGAEILRDASERGRATGSNRMAGKSRVSTAARTVRASSRLRGVETGATSAASSSVAALTRTRSGAGSRSPRPCPDSSASPSDPRRSGMRLSTTLVMEAPDEA